MQTSTASDTSTQTSGASEPTNSTTTHTQQSYADKEYGSYGPTNSVPTTDATKKADVDGDNQITTIYEANGYVPHTKTTVEKIYLSKIILIKTVSEPKRQHNIQMKSI
ncbi:hypothetical protein AAEZ42_00465 [Limosilactobacillus fermentum]